MQKLTLTKRPGRLGTKISSHIKANWKDRTNVVSIPLSGILLTPEELAVLLQDPEAHESLFTTARSKHAEPRFQGIEPIVVSDKFKDAKVTIRPDNAIEAIVLKPALVFGISIIPQVGGLTELVCKVMGAPDEHLQTLMILDRKCTVSILNGTLADRDDNQAELPLGEGGPAAAAETDGEDEGPTLKDAIDEEDDATESAIGRQIRGSEVKKKRANRKKNVH